MAIIGLSGKKQHGKDTVARIIQYLTKDKSNNLEIEQFINPHYAIDSYDSVKWKRKIFAGKLKEVVALLIGCTVEQLEDNDFKNKPLGEEWRRYWGYNYRMDFGPTMKGRLTPYYSTKEEVLRELNSSDETFNKYPQLLKGAIVKDEILTPRIILQELGTEGLRGIHSNFHVNALFADYKPENRKPLGEGFTISYDKWPNWIIADVRFPNEVEAIKKRGGLVFRVCNNRITDTDNHPSETSLDNYLDWDEIIDNSSSIENLIHKVQAILIKRNIV